MCVCACVNVRLHLVLSGRTRQFDVRARNKYARTGNRETIVARPRRCGGRTKGERGS